MRWTAHFFGEADTINPFDYRKLAENLARIERAARTLTQEEEKPILVVFFQKFN